MPFDFLERTADAYIPWQGHISDHAVLFSDSSVYAMLELDGIRWETLSPLEHRARADRLNHTWKQISDDDLTITIFYQRSRLSDDAVQSCGLFSNPFSSEFDQRYRAGLVAGALYANRIFMGIQVSPKVYGSRFVHDQITYRKKAAAVADDERAARLEDVVHLLMSDLRPYNPRRLGVRFRGRVVFSEIAEAVVLLQSGVWRPIPLSTGPLSQTMVTEHAIIDRDHVRLLLPGGVWYACMFGMRHFPTPTNPRMFSRLLSAPYRSTVCQSFRFLKTSDAQEIMRRKKSRMWLAKDDAEEQREDLAKAASRFRNADYVMGEYSFGLAVFAPDLHTLGKVATEAWTDLGESGMTVARERLGLEAAYYSLLPGNAYYRPRPGYVSSKNYARMAPMHAFLQGPEESHWGKPIIILRSPGHTKIRFHYHWKGVGNLLVTGETGGGKTTTVAAFLLMTEGRARIFALDQKRGWELLIRRMGGSYAVLGDGEPHFAPLKALSLDGEHGNKNFEFLLELLRGCILLDGLGDMTSEEDRLLALGIRSVMALPNPEDRWLEEVCNFLGVSASGAAARLRKWCWGEELGWVIDAPVDTLDLSDRLHAADTTALLDNKRACGPALLYLFHRIELELDGTPVLIPLDEGWRALLIEIFRPMIEKRFRTIRSLNGVFIFITQGPRELVASGLASTIISQCPTHIHLPDPRGKAEDYVGVMGMTEGEFATLKSLPEGQGFFLLRQGTESMVAQLPLPDMEEFVTLLSSRASTLKLFRQALAETEDTDQAFEAFKEAVALEEAPL